MQHAASLPEAAGAGGNGLSSSALPRCKAGGSQQATESPMTQRSCSSCSEHWMTSFPSSPGATPGVVPRLPLEAPRRSDLIMGDSLDRTPAQLRHPPPHRGSAVGTCVVVSGKAQKRLGDLLKGPCHRISSSTGALGWVTMGAYDRPVPGDPQCRPHHPSP